MSIISMNFKDLADNAETKFKNPKIKWKPNLVASFLDHALPILASVKLEYVNGLVSATNTLTPLKTPHMITTPNGEIHSSNVIQLIKFLYFAKRGDLILGSQIRDSRLAALTPIFLYAHKLYNDVMYSAWDKTDPEIKKLLGYTLVPIYGLGKLPTLDIDQILMYREMALTFKSGAKTGTQEKPYNYKCGIKEIEKVELPRIVMMMMLQLWLAHSSVRNCSSMILDPLNWDNCPEALDIETALPEVARRKPAETKVKKWVDDLSW